MFFSGKEGNVRRDGPVCLTSTNCDKQPLSDCQGKGGFSQ